MADEKKTPKHSVQTRYADGSRGSWVPTRELEDVLGEREDVWGPPPPDIRSETGSGDILGPTKDLEDFLREAPADPEAFALLQTHIKSLRDEHPKVLAERYGLTPSDLTTTEQVAQVLGKLIGGAALVAASPVLYPLSQLGSTRPFDEYGEDNPHYKGGTVLQRMTDGGETPDFGREGALLQAERRRQKPTRYSDPEESATEMIDKLRRENQTSLGDK